MLTAFCAAIALIGLAAMFPAAAMWILAVGCLAAAIAFLPNILALILLLAFGYWLVAYGPLKV